MHIIGFRWFNAELLGQIISPHDTGIAAAIQANLEPKVWDVDSLTTSALCEDRTEDMKAAYFAALSSLSSSRYAHLLR